MNSKSYLRTVLKFLTLTILFFCICGAQTSMWPLFFGSFPVPQAWLTLIVFLILRWPLYSGIFFTYFLGFITVFFTHAPLKMIWIPLNLLYILLWTLKNRVNSSSLISFATLSAVSSLLFSSFYVLVSSVLETNPTKFFLLHRLTEAGLTFLISIPLYFVYNSIDLFFNSTEKWNNTFPQTQEENS